MNNPEILRDFLVGLTCAMAVGILAARLMVWWESKEVPTPKGEPPFRHMVWDVLAEARQITVDAANQGEI